MDGLPGKVAEQGDAADALLKTAQAKPAENVAPAPAAPSAPAAPAESLPPKTEDWKHKYDVLQGKYNREVRDMNQVIASQNTMIQELQTTLASSQAAPAASPATSGAAKTGLDTAKYENYGDEIVDLVRRVNEITAERDQLLRQVQAPQTHSAAPEIAQRLDRIEKVTDEQFYASLDAECSQWRELNVSDEFMNWADVPDETLGVKPIQALRRAYGERNHKAVSRIFKKFLETSGTKAKAPSVIVPQTEGGSNPQGVMPPGSNLDAILERVRKAQKDFIQKQITESDYNKIIAEYQTALKQAQGRR